MTILIDNGHGQETPGKRSPDGSLMEWQYTRTIANLVAAELTSRGYDVCLVTPEFKDIPLALRCKRVNHICDKKGAKNCLLVSIHCNAAGSDGKWHDARGWSVYVSQNASASSQRLAGCLFRSAKAKGLKMRQPSRFVTYWTQNLAICRDTACPAVLTENLFQDNKYDVAFLLSDEGKETVAQLHVDGILKYIEGLA